MKKIVDIINEEIAGLVEAGPRIRRLSSTAPVMDKILMWKLIGEKAWNLYKSRKNSEAWANRVNRKYAPYWNELYDEIRYTPEFIQYSKLNNIADDLHFSDMIF